MAPDMPRAGPRGNRPATLAPRSAKIKEARSPAMVARTRRAGPGQLVLDEAGLTKYPTALGTLYEPCPGRRWWMLVFGPCPWCGGHHRGVVRGDSYAGGARRSRCGRVVWVMVEETVKSEVTS